MTSRLLIETNPLQVIPELAKEIGLNEAILLQQVHYWLNPQFNKNFFNKRYWVYNTYAQWQEQFPFWCQRSIRSIVKNLENKGLLLSFIKKGLRKRKYYTIDYDRLNHLIKGSLQAQEIENQEQRFESSDPNVEKDRILEERDPLKGNSLSSSNKSSLCLKRQFLPDPWDKFCPMDPADSARSYTEITEHEITFPFPPP